MEVCQDQGPGRGIDLKTSLGMGFDSIELRCLSVTNNLDDIVNRDLSIPFYDVHRFENEMGRWQAGCLDFDDLTNDDYFRLQVSFGNYPRWRKCKNNSRNQRQINYNRRKQAEMF